MKTSRIEGSKAAKKKPAVRGNGAAVVAAQPGGADGDLPERRELLAALQAVGDGDFSVRLPGDWRGLDGKIADRFNGIVASIEKMADELARVGQVVGREG